MFFLHFNFGEENLQAVEKLKGKLTEAAKNLFMQEQWQLDFLVLILYIFLSLSLSQFPTLFLSLSLSPPPLSLSLSWQGHVPIMWPF